jgi:hypothetical protein
MEFIDCFNVCLNVPSVRKTSEISAVLGKFNGATDQIKRISSELTRGSEDGSIRGSGIPIKDLILSIELAIESNPEKTLEFDTFMQAFNSVNHA